MPVVVQCFQCNAILELDDGFRGGVCRCSSCGTLLQVPKGDEETPPARKVRPAVPPAPTSPVTPVQNATSSKLDVGLSRGQFEMPGSWRQDMGGGTGLGRIHQTKPIAASSKSRQKEEAGSEIPATPAKTGKGEAAGARKGPKLWVGLVLALVMALMLLTIIGYYVFFRVVENE